MATSGYHAQAGSKPSPGLDDNSGIYTTSVDSTLQRPN